MKRIVSPSRMVPILVLFLTGVLPGLFLFTFPRLIRLLKRPKP